MTNNCRHEWASIKELYGNCILRYSPRSIYNNVCHCKRCGKEKISPKAIKELKRAV